MKIKIIDKDPQRHIEESRVKLFEKISRSLYRSALDYLKTSRFGIVNKDKPISIKLPSLELNEPIFHYTNKFFTFYFIGYANDQFSRGDRIYVSWYDKVQLGILEGAQNNAEMDMILTYPEFQKILFAQLELPNLFKNAGLTTQTKRHRAGIIKQGIMAKMDLRKTLIQAQSRKIALKTKTPYIDDTDLRYKFYTKKPEPSVSAVMFCIMDTSGSMSDDMKMLAKVFFYLLACFIRSKYKYVEIRFIAHTDTAWECSERSFFYRESSGGTNIAAALELTNKIIDDTYSSNWHVYVAQAGDGDDWNAQNSLKQSLHQLQERCQYIWYTQIKQPTSTYLELFYSFAKKYSNMDYAVITNMDNLFKAFVRFFKPKGKA